MTERRPLRVALTGGIAAGKSYCLQRFAELGAATIDADVLARDVVAAGTPGLAEIVARFGHHVQDASGALDRAALGRLVFSDATARRDLESIVHPRVYDAVQAWYDDLIRASPSPAVAIADIPLLYEGGRAGAFDCVVAVRCSAAQQLNRLMTRSGLSPEEATARIASQWSMADKAARADYVIDTSGSFEETDRQVRDVWTRLTRDASGRR